MPDIIKAPSAKEMDTGGMNAPQLTDYFNRTARANAVTSTRIALFPFVADMLTQEADRAIEA